MIVKYDVDDEVLIKAKIKKVYSIKKGIVVYRVSLGCEKISTNCFENEIVGLAEEKMNEEGGMND